MGLISNLIRIYIGKKDDFWVKNPKSAKKGYVYGIDFLNFKFDSDIHRQKDGSKTQKVQKKGMYMGLIF